MSVDPRRTQPFCTPDCEERCCRCGRWPLYQNRWGVYVCGEEPEPEPWDPGDPLPVSGLLPEHWYRSDQGLWKDAGINPAVLDGDVVGRWEDITANNDHVNQAAAASKPTLQNGAGDLLNGHPVIRFDGIDDYLQGAFTTGGQMNQPNTSFIVAVLDAAQINDNANRNFFDGDDAAHESTLFKSAAPAPDAYALWAGALLSSVSVPDGNWHIFTALFNGVASQTWRAGISIVGPGNAGAENPDGLTIGANAATGGDAKIDVTEYLCYDADLPDADKNTVGQYFATRYGLAYADI